MTRDDDLRSAANVLSESIGNVARRVRQTRIAGGLSWRESSALSRLVRGGPATSAELARAEVISPQSMGTTLGALDRQGLITRGADPDDGRRVVLSATDAGRRLHSERTAVRAEQISKVLAAEFSDEEIGRLVAAAPLLNRFAERLHALGVAPAVDPSRLAAPAPADTDQTTKGPPR